VNLALSAAVPTIAGTLTLSAASLVVTGGQIEGTHRDYQATNLQLREYNAAELRSSSLGPRRSSPSATSPPRPSSSATNQPPSSSSPTTLAS
jgi:hypothetical protein